MPNRSIVYLLICLTGVLSFIFIGIVPYQKNLALLREKISMTQSQIEEQKGLSPYYKLLNDRVSKRDSTILSFPAKEKLSGQNPDTILANLGDFAKQSNLDLLFISPDPTSMANDSKFLLFNMVVRGGFFNFRKFLNNLAETTYLDHIDEIQIQSSQNNLEFKLKFWVILL